MIDKNGSGKQRIASDFLPDIKTVITWSPDDKKIAIQGHKFSRGYASNHDIWLVDFEVKYEPKPITKEVTSSPGNSLYCDVLSPFGRSVPQKLSWKEDNIYFLLSEKGRVNLARVNTEDGIVEKLEETDSVIYSFSVGRDRTVFTGVDQNNPPELWELELNAGSSPKPATELNGEFINNYEISGSEHVKCETSDDEIVDSWLMKPETETNKKYPLILFIHGGPKSMLGHSFMHEFQYYAANGFGVLYANPRGSHGYSEEFADIRGHYGERDMQDILELIDHVVEKYDWIDRGKVGVTGISYGGFMTNWLVTQTDRFSVAISEEGISNQISMFANTDIGFYFEPDALDGDPWNNTETYLEKSPLMKAPEVNTPIMFVHAMDDYRCWADQSIEFYTALKYMDKETKLLLFPKGGHIFAWTGKPSHRKERLQHKLSWFEKWL